MTELLTAAQMRAIEHAAIDSGEVTGLELMERAGQGVVEAIFEEWPDLKKTSHRAVVLCGPGNNGGDGFVVARLLKDWGWEVEVFLYGDAEKLPPDAKVNFERWEKFGQTGVFTLLSAQHASMRMAKASTQDGVLIDALFGTGLSRPLVQDLYLTYSYFLSLFPLCDLKTVAIDVPSGQCADSGRMLQTLDDDGGASNFDLVVTFHTRKVGHLLNLNSTSKLIVKNIGIKSNINANSMDSISLWELDSLSSNWPEKSDNISSSFKQIMDALNPESTVELIDGPYWEIDKAEIDGWHKFSHGHALICSGPATKTGAARLAARGALKIGAGLVTIASPSDALSENAAQLTAIILRKMDTTDQFKTLLSDDRISSVCIGPGFARENESGGLNFNHTRAMVKTALSTGKNTVLDADALTAFKDTPDDLFKLLHKKCVLTPHGGEFKRLFPDIHAKLMEPATTGPAYSKVDATRDAAKLAGCIVLFKGPDTVIADPQGRASINSAHYDRTAPWLATAGSGDVLAGFIAGLLARGFDPMQAAESAAWLHVECALKFGAGLIAEDIPEQLPAVFRDLGL